MLTKGETYSIARYTGRIFRPWDILKNMIFCMEIEYTIIIISIEVRDWKGTRAGDDFAFGKCLKCFRIYCKKVCINGKHLGLGQNKKKGLNQFGGMILSEIFFRNLCV